MSDGYIVKIVDRETEETVHEIEFDNPNSRGIDGLMQKVDWDRFDVVFPEEKDHD